VDPGQTIAHYEILEKLGSGGMGVVYKAHDPKLNRTVALKFLPPHVSSDDEVKARFVREAQAASALDHTGICTVHEIGESKAGELYIVMAYYDGQTLRRRLKHETFTVEQALDIARHLARAVGRAHEAGIVHRDIKPANIMLTERGEVKLLDFGLAKLAGGGDLTKTGSTAGTAAYMSPEQIRGEAAGPASDIWSLGVVLYEMLAGRPPFGGDYDQSLLYAVLNEDPVPLEGCRPGVTEDIAAVVMRCLDKNPKSRFASTEEFMDALGLSDSSQPVTGRLSIDRGSRRKTYYVGAVALAALLMAVALISLDSGETPHTGSGVELRIVPLSRNAGSERWPSISPDGNQVAYAWDGGEEGDFDIYVSVVGEASYARLTTDPANDLAPRWSPDGRSLSFLRCDTSGDFLSVGQSCSVHVMTALGGSERRIGNLSGRVSEPIWHPNGDWVISGHSPEPGAPSEVVAISLGSGETIRLTTPPAISSFGDSVHDVLPDGSGVLFYRNRSMGVSDLYLLPLSRAVRPDGEPRLLASEVNRVGSEFWAGATGAAVSGDGQHVLYSSDHILWKVELSPNATPEPILRVGRVAEMDADRQGSKIVYSRTGISQTVETVWRFSLTGEGSVPERLIRWSASFVDVRYSPDDLHISFASNRTGSHQIWIASADGTDPRQLTSFMNAGDTGTPRWSPDGRHIVFDSRPEGNSDIFVVSSDGDTPSRLTSHPADDTVPSWSPTGDWIYFSSRRTGTDEVWKMRPDGSEVQQVTSTGGFHAMESPVSHYLYYSKENVVPTELWRMAASGGEEEPVCDLQFGWRAFDVGSSGVYVLRPLDLEGGLVIERLDDATGESSVVFELSPRSANDLASGMFFHGTLAVSSGATSAVLSAFARPEFDLDLVEGPW
jgi:serine/threonine protein kinase